MKNLKKASVLFLIGAFLYCLIEILWRGRTHWTMGVVGGILFLILGEINEFLPWDFSLLFQGVLGALAITFIELIAGIILNLYLKLNIWNYSNLPFNFLGQICPQFSLAWLFLSFVGIILDDWIRYLLWDEERPHYHFFPKV